LNNEQFSLHYKFSLSAPRNVMIVSEKFEKKIFGRNTKLSNNMKYFLKRIKWKIILNFLWRFIVLKVFVFLAQKSNICSHLNNIYFWGECTTFLFKLSMKHPMGWWTIWAFPLDTKTQTSTKSMIQEIITQARIVKLVRAKCVRQQSNLGRPLF
jgi:hypothetical protein